MADYLLGMDYGTGGAKACIIDWKGRCLVLPLRNTRSSTTSPAGPSTMQICTGPLAAS